jgi:hypothetical protein
VSFEIGRGDASTRNGDDQLRPSSDERYQSEYGLSGTAPSV